MSRIRTIKPQFFTDEIIAELSPLARLLFIGLWTLADREGRLEDRAKRIKVELLPYDDADVDEMLNILADHHFITRYTADFHRYIQIRTFEKHQNLNPRESASVIPRISTDDDASASRSSRVRRRANLKKIRAHLKSANTEGREGIGNGREGKEKQERAREASFEMVEDQTAPASASNPFSDEYLDELQADPAYAKIEVRYVCAKMLRWCKEHGKEPTRDRLLRWLNREIPRKEQGEDNGPGNTKAKIDRVVQKLVADHSLD